MKNKSPIDILALACVFAALLVLMSSSPTLAQMGKPDTAPGSLVTLVADFRYNPARVPAPPVIARGEKRPQSPDFVPFVVTYNPANCEGTITNWPADAQTAFTYAAEIWARILNGTQTIHIDACWRTDLDPPNLQPGDPRILGSAKATEVKENFTNTPITNTLYAVALANQLSGQDLNGNTSEITANFNANFSSGDYTWYFGMDGNTPENSFDFVSVVLHEIGHGLGFAGSMNWDDGISDDHNPQECNNQVGSGCWGIGADLHPEGYDHFTAYGGSTWLLKFPNNSLSLGNALVSKKIYFIGTNAVAANRGSDVKLYAPSLWDEGSSYSHLDDATFDCTPNTIDCTWNALMTHALNHGESAHYPGAVTLGILNDIGWDIPNLATTYVDSSNSGTEDGSSANPFNTVEEGMTSAETSGQLLIKPGTYPENILINRPMIISRWDTTGVVVIGGP